MRIKIRFVRMRIPCGRHQFDSIRIECAFDPDKCARVDTPRVPDHSLVRWEVMIGSMEGKVEEEGQQVSKMRKIVPENYLQKEEETCEI